METWTQRFLLNGLIALVTLAASVLAQAEQGDRPLIEPDVRPQQVDEALIDTENFEVGAFFGVIHIEDFESSMVWGARLAYHLNESFFIEGNLGFADAGETSFEKLGGNVQLLSDEDREYTYYDVGFGYNILPGESFFKVPFVDQHYTVNTNFYLTAGGGATDFAGDNRFTFVFGGGYQMIINDFLSFHISMREHLYDIDVTGETKTSYDSEVRGSLSVFF
ncbi:MAG: outer membrane beta-barrel domain-containing protein [Oleiphilaceae bacterium]|nr:outer membrane beta-barrel domain-containing protein [Oleiphilaceae bacterium]